MTLDFQTAASLAVAGLVGLAVGIEREWSGHATGPGARFAGVRTFLLLGLLGGVAGLLLLEGQAGAAVVLLLGGAALTVAAYIAAVRLAPTDDAVDGTTEAAALLVLALALLAGMGRLRLAAAMGAVMVLALREKSTIQAWLRRIDEVELRAGLQFAVLALVLLPILPQGPYGPFGGVRPRELWMVVLLVSGLNFLGYLAQRVAGHTRGRVIAGILGGLVSSTAVALSFSRTSHEPSAPARALATGVVGASTTLIPRLLTLTLFLQPAMTARVAAYLALPFVAGTAFVLLAMRQPADESGGSRPVTGNPLRLGSAILLAIGFQLTLMLMIAVKERFGEQGVVASAAIMGLTDMDALTFSMTRLAGDANLVGIAALAMAIGVLTNTLLKLGVAVAIGAPAYRRAVALGLGVMALASVAGILLAR